MIRLKVKFKNYTGVLALIARTSGLNEQIRMEGKDGSSMAEI
jgi:hypothetical protein